jgi:hypothetical protein
MKNIDLDDLYCPVPSSDYSEKSIELLAESIAATGGLLRPLIVQALVVDEGERVTFEVVDGFLHYWAAVRAEQDNLLLQWVPCWIIADSSELEVVLAQLECLSETNAGEWDYSLPIVVQTLL